MANAIALGPRMTTKSEFLDSIKLDLSPFHLERLRLIDTFDYSPALQKVSRDKGGLTPAYLRQGELALKQYYAVALLDPLNEHAVSKLVDPFWHCHVLFTKEYVRFCGTIFGGYIHHAPLDPSDENEVSSVGKLYDYTLKTYKKIFKQIDPEWWPEVAKNDPQFAIQIVCKHMLVQDADIVANALFKRVKKRQAA